MGGTNGSVVDRMFQSVSYNDIATESDRYTPSFLPSFLILEDTTAPAAVDLLDKQHPLSLFGICLLSQFFRNS
jgi:hypothetical protein